MSDDTHINRVLVVLTKDLLRRVDDYRYANRLPSRVEAIRRLLETGLAATKEPRRATP